MLEDTKTVQKAVVFGEGKCRRRPRPDAYVGKSVGCCAGEAGHSDGSERRSKRGSDLNKCQNRIEDLRSPF